ncbi:DUF296 domain-containing protein [bacterium]|nr:DUF296 domain-containing protein [bacterium]
MKYKIKGDKIIALFENNEKPLENLKELGKIADSNLVILSAIGMIEDPEIGYFNGKEYEKKIFKGCFELLGYHGNIIFSDHGYLPHVHISFADNEHKTYGGHLLSGNVHLMNEIILLKLNEKFQKEFDERTKLQLWAL